MARPARRPIPAISTPTDVDNRRRQPGRRWPPGRRPISGFGTYAVTAAGVWTYTVDDNNAAVQALNGVATLTDTFNVVTEDGTAQLVTITIHAQNDAATITGDAAGDVTEAGGVNNGHPGHGDRYRRSQFRRCRQSRRRLDAGRGRHRRRQWLWHLRDDGDRSVDLYPRRHRSGRAGAQRPRYADRYA